MSEESPPGVYDAWRVQEYASRGPFWEQLQAALARAERAEALVSTLGEALRDADQFDATVRPADDDHRIAAALEAFRAFTERAPAPVIRDDNVSSDLWLRQKANDALLAPHPPTNG